MSTESFVDYIIRPNIWNCFQLNLSFAVFGSVWLILWRSYCTSKSFALPYSCIREKISCVVGGWDWRVFLLHDWRIQVFHIVWTYMLAEEALRDEQNHMLTYVHWIFLRITYVLTSEIASIELELCCFWMVLVDSLTELLYFQIFCLAVFMHLWRD